MNVSIVIEPTGGIEGTFYDVAIVFPNKERVYIACKPTMSQALEVVQRLNSEQK